MAACVDGHNLAQGQDVGPEPLTTDEHDELIERHRELAQAPTRH